MIMNRHIWQAWSNFCVLNLYFRIAQIEYRGQTRYSDTPEFFLASLWWACIIILDMNWSNIFSLSTFFFDSMLIEQVIGLRRPQKSEKISTWNLGQIFKFQLIHFTLIPYLTELHNEIFSLCTFLAQSSSIFIDLRKVRTEILKMRTDLWDQVIDGWSITQ